MSTPRNQRARIRAYRKSGNMVAQTFATHASHGAANLADSNHAHYCAGLRAYESGASSESNPNAADTEPRTFWSKGWCRGWQLDRMNHTESVES